MQKFLNLQAIKLNKRVSYKDRRAKEQYGHFISTKKFKY